MVLKNNCIALTVCLHVFKIQESVRQKQIGKLEEELKTREQEFENMLSRQREVRLSKSNIR